MRQMFDDLPPAGTRRWVMRRKAEVVAAVRAGRLTLDDVRDRYDVGAREFARWAQLVDEFGRDGLSATRVQRFRGLEKIL